MRSNKEVGMEDEFEYAKTLISKISNEDIRDRIENMLIWYIKRAASSKRWYYIFTLSSIIAGASVPIISLSSGAELKDIIVAAISAIGAISISVCTLFSFKDNWRRYRKYSELLKRECFMFISHSGIYEDVSKDINQLFIDQIENVTSTENEEWVKTKSSARGNN